MNDKQKIFAVVGVTCFALWILLSAIDEAYFRMNDLFEEIEAVIALGISIGCAVGFFLFTDK